jgi:hypothetical protein
LGNPEHLIVLENGGFEVEMEVGETNDMFGVRGAP